YQYYSHVSIIMECIKKFDLLPLNNKEEIINHLRFLNDDENYLLKDINQTYQILQDCFQNITHQHLQLVKKAVECSNVINMMEESYLYSTYGRHCFQEL
ncbi:unnamed protein product, partial [Rotaria sp. Silwood2]